MSISSMYGNPYPTSWGSVFGCSYTQPRFFTLPTNRALVQWTFGFGSTETGGPSYFATPRTHAPLDIKIGDQPFFPGGTVALAAAPVTLTWSPVVGANSYQVQIRRIYANGTNALAEVVAQVTTADTTMTIPATVFLDGDFYQFMFTTQASAGNYAQGHLRRTAFPNGGATFVSGMFRVSSLCGNHTKDAGEECDEGGDTATCDRDCSLPVCGDGLHNAMANEMCDDALASNRCDPDCTPAMCGDGFWNNQIEQCDDGNQVSGDGCDPMCGLERCGNGMTDPFETCDDGNHAPADGCSELCRTEAGYLCTGTPSVCTRP